MIETVFIWSGAGRFTHTRNVDKIYGTREVSCMVVDNYRLKDYMDALQLIHGGSLNVVMLWDWADTVFDRINDPRNDTNIDHELFLVGSNRNDLHEIWFKHQRIKYIRDTAESMRRCELDPPAQFIPPKEFFI